MNYDHYVDCSLGLAADLVNSFDAVVGSDRLTRAALDELLARYRVSFAKESSPLDLAGVKALREHLRQVFTSTDLTGTIALLNRLLAESGALPRLTDHDGEPLHLHYERPDADLADQLAADIVMGLAAVVVRDGLDRFRTCAADDCAYVFVDLSRNRSRRYCDPDTCANRAHVAAHRARQRAARAHAG